jgi:hypothetical protein
MYGVSYREGGENSIGQCKLATLGRAPGLQSGGTVSLACRSYTEVPSGGGDGAAIETRKG